MDKITIKPSMEIYQDNKKEYRWRIKILGKIVGASTEGYINRNDCLTNIQRIEEHIKYFRENSLIL
jgi:uncharacterized protein YegP (UPF0339 family)